MTDLSSITAPAATDELIAQFVNCVQDRQKHEHPAEGQGEDFFCMNLACYMGERMGAVLARIRDAGQQLAQVAKIADQIDSAIASAAKNRDERIEAAIERDGVWSSSRDPGIARVSAAIDIQTSISKRLRRALAGGEPTC